MVKTASDQAKDLSQLTLIIRIGQGEANRASHLAATFFST
jgi:hypothetical protein